jgi:hypothetical protein
MNIKTFLYNESGQPARTDYPQAANNPGGQVAKFSITSNPGRVKRAEILVNLFDFIIDWAATRGQNAK